MPPSKHTTTVQTHDQPPAYPPANHPAGGNPYPAQGSYQQYPPPPPPQPVHHRHVPDAVPPQAQHPVCTDTSHGAPRSTQQYPSYAHQHQPQPLAPNPYRQAYPVCLPCLPPPLHTTPPNSLIPTPNPPTALPHQQRHPGEMLRPTIHTACGISINRMRPREGRRRSDLKPCRTVRLPRALSLELRHFMPFLHDSHKEVVSGPSHSKLPWLTLTVTYTGLTPPFPSVRGRMFGVFYIDGFTALVFARC